MKFRLLIIFMVCLFPLIALAKSDPGKDGNRCKKKTEKVQSVEDFVFMLPAPSRDKVCKEREAYREAIVSFYKWYRDNENKIMVGLSHENKGKDLIPPFNISYQSLHDYFEFIRSEYPQWVEGVDPVNAGSSTTLDFSKLAH